MSDQLHVDSKALDRYEHEAENSIAIRSLDDIKRVSLIFVKSGMFKGDNGLNDEQKMYQAGVKIIAGVEFGIQPFAAMRGINIIKGNAEMSANLMAAKVKKHPKYDYRVKRWDNDGCELTFFEYMPDGTKEELGPSSFTIEDAKAAGLTSNDTWRKFARNMCFARAMSNGVRIHCPDVFYGAPVYTEGEISGNFEDMPVATATTPKTEAVEAEVVTKEEPGTAEEHVKTEFPEAETTFARKDGKPMTPKQSQRIYKLGRELKMDVSKLEARVRQLTSEAEADEAIQILEGELADGGPA